MKNNFDIIGAPFGFGANIHGSSNAPEHLRDNGLKSKINQRIKNWGAVISDKGNVEVSEEVSDLIKDNNKAEAVAKYCNELKDKISKSLENGCKPIIIGGDHSITLGSASSINEFIKKNDSNKNLGLIWIDAHADLNYYEDGNIHGKSAAILLGKLFHNKESYKGLSNLISPQNIHYIGLQDIMPHEMNLLNQENIKFYGMDKIEEEGIIPIISRILLELEERTDSIFLSFDIDACDGAVYSGCGTPEIGGLSGREAIEIAYRVGQSRKFIGADIVEFAPENDSNNLTNQLMIKIIDSLWGYRY